MKKLVLAAVAAWAQLGTSAATNLIEGGDFSTAATNLYPLCRTGFGGVLTLATEPLTWNKCGKCAVQRGYPDGQNKGCTVHAANVTIGATGERPGFAVEEGVSYDFAFDIKGNVDKVKADLVYWIGEDDRKDRKEGKVALADDRVSAEWAIRKGSFTAPKGARRAALRLSIWSSSKWEKSRRQYKVGDWFMFDNVIVTKSKKNLDGEGDSAAAPIADEVRKTIAPGDSFSDLVSYKDGRTPAAVKTVFAVARNEKELVLTVTAEESGAVSVGNANRVWSGDAVEVIFGGKDDGRVKTHLAFNPAGAKYTAGSEAVGNDGWSLKTSVGEKSWKATVRVPFAFLGWQKPAGEIPLNVGRVRPQAKTFDVWTAKGGFHDVGSYGRLVVDGYAAVLKSEFGLTADVKNRAEFESLYATEKSARQAKKLARFKEAKFSVAPVRAVSDWSLPYLPEEIFDPPDEIRLKAAVNEIRALPLAIANLTARTEDYRVVLETTANSFVGGWGLEGFPEDRVTARRGVRFRDVENPDPSLRFDPLPRLDEAGIVTVPPKEAGLVWYDFDCSGVKPGVYKGRLRVMPLCEPGKCRSKNGEMDYQGKMQTIPVTLEVVKAKIDTRAAVPAGYFLGVESQAAFDTAFQIGAEHFQVNSYFFKFERDANGDLDLSRPKEQVENARKVVANHRAWAKKHGFVPKFKVVYTALEACKGMYMCKTPEKFARMWPQYVKSVKKVMNEADVPDTDYFIEVKDEPQIKDLDELLTAHRLAKAAVPSVRLAMLLGSWDLPQAKLEEFVPCTDLWILWRGKLSDRKFAAFAERLRTDGRDVYHYSCDTTMRLPVQGYYRHHAWFAEYHHLSGAYLYQLTDQIGGEKFGYKDFKSIPVAGLFYRSFGSPIPSLRMMALREGFTDVKFLAALREKQKRAPDPEIEKFLASAPDQVLNKLPNDMGCPDRLRDRARELLAK